MTNELDEEDHIVEFISAGVENYGYVTAQGKSCVKVKGFSLNVRGMAQLNYDVMKQNILDEIGHPLEGPRKKDIINPLHFIRDPVKKKYVPKPNLNRIGSCLISESWTVIPLNRFRTGIKD